MVKIKLPEYDFKIDCGHLPETRQWLDDNECTWPDGTKLSSDSDERFLFISNKTVTYTDSWWEFKTDNIEQFNPLEGDNNV